VFSKYQAISNPKSPIARRSLSKEIVRTGSLASTYYIYETSGREKNPSK